MFCNRFSKFQKIIVFLVIFFFIFQTGASALAQGPVSAPTLESLEFKAQAEAKAKEIEENFFKKITEGLILSGAITLRNVAVNLSKMAAQEIITFVSTGDIGQGPMFQTSTWEKMRDDIAMSVANKLLDHVMKSYSAVLGFNVCDPSAAVKLLMSDIVSLEFPQDPGLLKDRAVDCSFEKLVGNYEAFVNKYTEMLADLEDNPGAFAVALTEQLLKESIKLEKADIGKTIMLQDEISKQIREEKKAEELMRLEGLGGKPVTDVSGANIKVPAYLQREITGDQLKEAARVPGSASVELETAGNVIEEIPYAMAATFLNNLVSGALVQAILKQILDTGLSGSSVAYDPSLRLSFPKQQIEEGLNASLKRVSFSASIRDVNMLTDFTSCPDNRGLYNCVVDNDFGKAVQEKKTVQEAIIDGNIKANLPLISLDNTENNSDSCLNVGWCYSNLVKLRKARLIPIGWEIAASKATGDYAGITLAEVISYFDNDPSDTRLTDREREFARLIDPNWVLMSQKAQCNAFVSGPLLVGPGTSERAEVCSDLVDCVKEDNSGACQAWGYCAAEKNAFDLGGLECIGAYDSCHTLSDREGNEVNYVLNTVDYEGCDADNVGCKWYSMVRADLGFGLNWQADDDSKIFLNSKVENQECSSDQEGCSRLINTKAGLGTNLLINGGFELEISETAGDGNANDFVLGWDPDLEVVTGMGNTAGGDASLRVTNDSVDSESLMPFVPKPFMRFFAVSAEIKKEDADATIAFSLSASGLTFEPMDDISDYDITELAVESWKPSPAYRIFKIDSIPPAKDTEKLKATITVSGGSVLIDNVVVEEIDEPTTAAIHDYSEYAVQNAVYLKKAPEYLQCYNTDASVAYGRPVTDTEINFDDFLGDESIKGCTDFAGLCTANEVGCESYSPVGTGQTVNGVAAYTNYCPSACVGYSTFSQQPTYFEDGEFPLFFISSTADVCSADQKGCEEFTNLDKLEQGGEAKEYYSQLRHCTALPENESSCENFYSWVASDVSGYQLKAYKLKVDGSAPEVLAGGECTEADWEAEADETRDCMQFYDEAGNVYYRLYSKTISCSENCHPYRRTEKYVTNAAGTAQEKCEARKGELVDGECVFMAIPEESIGCSSENAGCREYHGNFAGDEEVVLENDFSDGDLGVLDIDDTGTLVSSNGYFIRARKVATEPDRFSLAPGQYTLSFWARRSGVNYTGLEVNLIVDASGINYTEKLGSKQLLPADWQRYNYNFEITEELGYKPVEIEIVNSLNNNRLEIDNIKITKLVEVDYLIKNSWETDAVCDQDLLSSADQPQAQLGCREYQDRAGATHYLKNFSSLCNESRVGCEAFVDTKNNQYPLEKTFTENREYNCSGLAPELCNAQRERAKERCEFAGYDWQIVSAIQWCDWPSELTVPEDSLIYLVNNEEAQCLKNEKGCQALGLPELTVDSAGDYVVKTEEGIELWENMFYRVDPDLFEDGANSPLCSGSEMGCELYAGEGADLRYFRDPGDKICSYIQRDDDTGYISADWYRDNGARCGSTSYYNDGHKQMIRNTDENYDGWVGNCLASANQCTAFIDPTDIVESENGRAYYAINDDNIDQSCTGVSRRNGCVLFNDSSQVDAEDRSPILNKNAFATYIKANAEEGHASVSAETTISNWKDIFEDQANITEVEDACEDFDYCKAMIQCIGQEKTVEDCLDEFREKDVVPATDDSQEFYCSSNSSANEAERKAEMLENALCTARETMVLDTNTIIRVQNVRECAAWYTCKSSHWVWDAGQSKYIEFCDSIGLCNRLEAGSSTTECANFIGAAQTNNILSYNQALTNSLPGDSNYQMRDTGWYSYDYSGNAIPSKAPLQFYDAIDLVADDNNRYCGGSTAGADCTDNPAICRGDDSCERVSRTCGGQPAGKGCDTDEDCEEIGEFSQQAKDYRLVNVASLGCDDVADCESAGFCSSTDSDECRCLSSGVCLQAEPGQSISLKEAEEPACRAYPESDSPFPVVAKYDPAMERAKIIWSGIDDDKKGNDYGCLYQKRTFGGGAIVKYLPRSSEYSPVVLPTNKVGYCQDQPELACDCSSSLPGYINNAQMCSTADCISPGESSYINGTCLKEDKGDISEYRGWQGYCLEKDLSKNVFKFGTAEQKPCLSWYPAHQLAGLQDTQNQFYDAGYNPAENQGNYFCLAAKGLNQNFNNTGPERANDYIRILASIGHYDASGPSGSDKLLTNEKFHLAAVDYGERLQLSSSSTPIYADDLLGIVISVKDVEDAEEWPSDASDLAEQAEIEGAGHSLKQWYQRSNQLLSLVGITGAGTNVMDDPYFDGFFIPIVQPEWEGSGLNRAVKEWEQANYFDENLVKRGSMYGGEKYNRNGEQVLSKDEFADDPYIGVWKDWFYYQAVWPGAPYNNWQSTPHTFLMDDRMTNSSSEDYYNVAPYTVIFTGGGYDDEDNVCKDLLTGNVWRDDGKVKNLWTGETRTTESYNDICSLKGATDAPIAWDDSSLTLSFDQNCWTDYDDADLGNYFGIRVLFDEDEKYRGIWYSLCSNNDTEGGWLDIELSFIMKEYCTDLVKVKNPVPVDNNNKARTNNLYRKEQGYQVGFYPETVGAEKNFKIIYIGNGKYVVWDSINEPMGSSSESVDPVNAKWYIKAGEGDQGEGGSLFVGQTAEGSVGADVSLLDDQLAGKPYTCPGGKTTQCTGETAKVYAKNILMNYFADSFGAWSWHPGANAQYQLENELKFTQSDNTAIAKPPIVAAAMPIGNSSNGSEIYGAVPHQLSLNNQISGEIKSFEGQKDVRLKFYAWADDDQMPLKNVEVWWGDGGSSVGGEGLYQNHKQICQKQANEPLGECKSSGTIFNDFSCRENKDCEHLKNYIGSSTICELSNKADDFGDSSDACHEGYFAFDHQYTCATTENIQGCSTCSGPTLIESINHCANNEPCKDTIDGKDVCRYSVKVQVTDNWGWCNEDGGGDGFYSEGGFVNKCDPDNEDESAEYFDGFIYVAPSEFYEYE